MYSILFSVISVLSSIYSLNYADTGGNNISMNNYQGKKILLVNIATSSPKVNQLSGLQQLQQQYGDSLVIIAFPSNSFGNETRSDIEIRDFCQSSYGATFHIAQKNPVAGVGIQSIYAWLGDINQNGEMNGTVTADFTKFLIDKDGSLIGVFSPKVEPMDNAIQNAITTNF